MNEIGALVMVAIVGIIFFPVIFGKKKKKDDENLLGMELEKKRNRYSSEIETEHIDYSNFFDRTSAFGVDLKRVSIGELSLGCGNLVACDFFNLGESSTFPYLLDVEAGNYNVDLLVAQLPDDEVRVALAKIMFNDGEVCEWKLAETKEELAGFHASFTVDSGLACFADTSTAEKASNVLKEFYTKNPEGNYYTDVLKGKMENGTEWLDFKVSDNENAIIFSSGAGDGLYSSFVGVDKDGKAVCLVTDFMLFTKECELIG